MAQTSAVALLLRVFSLLLFLVLSSASAEEASPPLSANDVRLTRNGDSIRIEIDMLAPVSLETAWQVLTDFEHMARFVPNLERSIVTERKGNRLRIEQQGRIYFGPFAMGFGSTREIELKPMREIRAHQLSGTARAMGSVMRLSPANEGTQLEYRADITPETYLPPIFGPGAVRREMADQFSAILNEMRARTAADKR